MIRTALTGLCACILAAPVLAAPAAAQTPPARPTVALPLDGATLTAATYSCNGGEPFQVRYLNAGPNSLALISVDGQERIFVNVISGSGARYVSGQYEWWSKGDGATLTNLMEENSAQDCVAAGE